jgi:hypothetical protein
MFRLHFIYSPPYLSIVFSGDSLQKRVRGLSKELHGIPPCHPHRLEGDRRLRRAIKRAAPTTDQIRGKECPPIRRSGKSGRSNLSAIKIPIRAPIKPRAIDARHPMFFRPAIFAPMAPVIDATNSKNKKEKNVILLTFIGWYI